MASSESSAKQLRMRLKDTPVYSIYNYIKYAKYSLLESNKANSKELEDAIDHFTENITGKERARLRRRVMRAKLLYGFDEEQYFYFSVDQLNKNGIKNAPSTRYLNSIYAKMNPYKRNKYGNYERLKKFYKRKAALVLSENDEAEFNRILDQLDTVILKPAFGLQGRSICLANCDEVKRKGIQALLTDYPDGVILEEQVKNVDELRALHPQSLNTVRVQTLRGSGEYRNEVRIFLAILKIGTGDNVADNGIQGGITCLVDIETGLVVDAKDHIGKNFYYHPDTGIQILGFKIPQWEECKKFAAEIARYDDLNQFVAWDLALTEDGWVVIEGNPRGAMFDQLTAHLPLTERMKKMFAELHYDII